MKYVLCGFFAILNVLCLSGCANSPDTSGEDFSASIDTDTYKLSLKEDGSFVLSHKKKLVDVAQIPTPYKISDVRKFEKSISYSLQSDVGKFAANLTIIDDSTFEIDIVGDGDMSAALSYPSSWQMRKSDIGIYPYGNGYAFPVDMPEIPVHKKVNACGGVLWSMWLYGFKRDGLFIVGGLENGYDAEFTNEYRNGLFHTSLQWLPEKGKFGYVRKVRFFIGNSLADVMKKYRAWRSANGFVKTLNEKSQDLPHLERLKGAADFWIWEDNLTNRLYGRPDIPNVPKRNVKEIASQMRELGIDKVLWNCIEAESPDDVQYLKSLGFLVGKYDIYRDVLPADIADKIIPYRVERSVNTKYWPHIVCVEKDGSYRKAWKVHGLDGKMYWQHGVCEICAYELTKKNVSAELLKIPYNSRFIDVQATTAPLECYSQEHPATRTVGAENIRKQQNFLTQKGLVNGVECGQECYASTYHYAEGLLSPPKMRVPDSGRKMTHSYRRIDMPEATEKYMLNAEYRIPLWELVYHDCVVNYWYWGDSTCACPELMQKFDNFDALYGYPPIYSLDVSHWNQLKYVIAQSYKRVISVVSKVAFEEMTNFEYLTADKKVQRTTFANGVWIIANFSNSYYVLPNGNKLAPWTFTTGKTLN